MDKDKKPSFNRGWLVFGPITGAVIGFQVIERDGSFHSSTAWMINIGFAVGGLVVGLVFGLIGRRIRESG